MIRNTLITNGLNDRRASLGMTVADLAERSGVSVATVNRVLGGDRHASFDNIARVAGVLGVDVVMSPRGDAEKLKRAEARAKAERLVRIVQGTSSLEGQAVDDETVEAMIQDTMHELLRGSGRRVWSP